MSWFTLFAELGQRVPSTSVTLAEDESMAFPIKVASGADAVCREIKSGKVAQLVIFASLFSEEITDVLMCFRSEIGPIPEFIGIVCNDPDPIFMARVFDFGVETFFGTEHWNREIAEVSRKVRLCLEEPNSIEVQIIKTARSTATDLRSIDLATETLQEASDYDYRAATALGVAAAATDRMDDAIVNFQKGSRLNKLFRPASAFLGETLLTVGRVDEAILVFKKLEQTNPFDLTAKALLASAYMEKGEFDLAAAYSAKIKAREPKNELILELAALEYLNKLDIKAAIEIMQTMTGVSTYFCARANDVGISLFRRDQGTAALELFVATHRLVPKYLKYKVTLNKALVLHQLGNTADALIELEVCRREYRGDFPKLQKLRALVSNGIQDDSEASNQKRET